MRLHCPTPRQTQIYNKFTTEPQLESTLVSVPGAVCIPPYNSIQPITICLLDRSRCSGSVNKPLVARETRFSGLKR